MSPPASLCLRQGKGLEQKHGHFEEMSDLFFFHLGVVLDVPEALDKRKTGDLSSNRFICQRTQRCFIKIISKIYQIHRSAHSSRRSSLRQRTSQDHHPSIEQHVAKRSHHRRQHPFEDDMIIRDTSSSSKHQIFIRLLAHKRQ